ncbi:AAA family ATPase [Demequina sp. SYSU T00039]|uniref:AAA family ATPase n=1 Tax=Demequina lignilytica TaxID=3051663 RepID=A0AAW7M885_9MICO|nr:MULTISPECIES: AAA family ATPase [unclassified Demequina]MDN4486801.1 AAA family ATPase [Demequina sp. SYSU T00039]MDN4489485.1 AAA family ATPase [Demequina sp. SYSU T00068]
MNAIAPAGRMVGRRQQADTIRAAVRDGAEGRPRVLVVRGEAGIGKSRLITEMLAEAAADEAGVPRAIAVGHCVDMGPIAAPFTPFRHALRALMDAVGVDAFRAAAGGTATLVPIGSLLPELAPDEPERSRATAEVAEAIEVLVENLTADVHAIVVLEDLHWADPASLALVATLAATLRATHLTLVLTYRSDDVGRGHPLRAVLAELERNRAVATVDVAPLSAEEIEDQAHQIMGRPPTARELAELVARTDGVPFFVEELLDLPPGPLPDSLRDVVLARYDRLATGARSVAKLAAVAGMRVDDETLGLVWQGDPEGLVDGLQACVAAHLLVVDGAGYTFRHALVHEAVYQGLLPSERARHHAAIAEALEARAARGERELAAGIAAHWFGARDAARAFDATVAALAEARDTHAFETCAQLGERVLELWRAVEDPAGRAGRSRAALAADIARDYFAAGRKRDALTVVDDALDACTEATAFERAALHQVATRVSCEADGCGCGVDHLAQLEKIVKDSADPELAPLRANALAMRAVHRERAEDGLGLSDEALAIAEAVGDRHTLGPVLRLRGIVLQTLGRNDEVMATLARATEVDGPDSETGLIARNNRVDQLMVMGRYAEAVDAGLRAIEQAIAAGRERSCGGYIHANVAEALAARGRVDEAFTHAHRASVLWRGESGRWLSIAQRAEAGALLWDGDTERFLAIAAELRPVVQAIEDDVEETANWARLGIDAAVSHALTTGGVERRRAVTQALETARVLANPDLPEHAVVVRDLLVSGGRVLALAAEWGIEADPALEAGLRATVDRFPADRWTRPMHATMRAYLADLAGDGDRLSRWTAVRDATAVEGGRVALALTARYEHARALLDAGARAEAIASLTALVDDAEEQHTRLVAGWARSTLARLGAGGHGSDDDAGVGLTPREREVLELIAEGLTNVQIGQRLFISPKTASVHVSSILAKLGAANRAEAAAWFAAEGTRSRA